MFFCAVLLLEIVLFCLTYSTISLLQPKYHGTLKPADNFDAEKDADALKKAMQGSGKLDLMIYYWIEIELHDKKNRDFKRSLCSLFRILGGRKSWSFWLETLSFHCLIQWTFCLLTDKDAIVTVLGARTNKQRQEIAAKYQQKYSKVKWVYLFFLEFMQKAIVNSHLSSSVVQSGLFCGYGARLRCHRNFFGLLFMIFLDLSLLLLCLPDLMPFQVSCQWQTRYCFSVSVSVIFEYWYEWLNFFP